MEFITFFIVITIVGGIVGGLLGPIVESVKKHNSQKESNVKKSNDSSENVSLYTKVVGVTFDNIQSILPQLKSGMPLLFIREPQNAYDKNAIAVYCNGYKIGHLSAELAADLAPLIDNGNKLIGKIEEITGGGSKNYGCNISIVILNNYSSNYKATKEIYNFCIDENAKVWWNKNTLGTPQVHKYDDILDFELVVDDKTTKGKNAIGRAIAGGLLFGGAGAVVGAGTAKRVNVVKSLYINVYLKGGGFEKLVFIQGGFKPDGFVYNVAIDSAHRVISILTEITSGNTDEAPAAPSEADNAEAIAKYKKLLDEGAIT